MHMRKNSLWKSVVIEALTHRGFFEWTACARLFVSYRNRDGLVAEVRGGHRVRFVWPNNAEREYKLERPTQIDSILDEVLAK